MAFTLSSPLSGITWTGSTSPTYTMTLGTAPTYNGKQYVVTALGGTQPSVSVHSPLIPFRFNYVTPTTLKTAAPQRNNANQLIANNRNKWAIVAAKGGLLLPSSSIYGTMNAKLEFDIPAGMETTSPNEIRAFVSMFFVALYGQTVGIADTMIAGG